MIKQLTLINKPERVVSLTFDEKHLLKWVIKLYNNNNPFDLDCTYSTGRMWRGLSEPLYKTDIAPQSTDVVQADCRNLPYANNTMSSIMFDPPFVVAPNCKPGIIRDRFSCYKDIPDLWGFYYHSLVELERILKPDGFIAFKCQDTVSGGINYMSHAAVIIMAQTLGLYVRDLFILGRKNVLWSPNMANQQHARKNHCYYLILQKSTKERNLRNSNIVQIINHIMDNTYAK